MRNSWKTRDSQLEPSSALVLARTSAQSCPAESAAHPQALLPAGYPALAGMRLTCRQELAGWAQAVVHRNPWQPSGGAEAAGGAGLTELQPEHSGAQTWTRQLQSAGSPGWQLFLRIAAATLVPQMRWQQVCMVGCFWTAQPRWAPACKPFSMDRCS